MATFILPSIATMTAVAKRRRHCDGEPQHNPNPAIRKAHPPHATDAGLPGSMGRHGPGSALPMPIHGDNLGSTSRPSDGSRLKELRPGSYSDMAAAARTFTDYRDALVMSYEEEISGEAYFDRLAEFFSGRQRQALLLLAEMERCTAAAMRPLIDRYGLATADPAELRAGGKAEADTQSGQTWPALIAGMASDLPVFVEEFEQIERLAPASDRIAIDTLTKHEIAAVDFAKKEAGGDPDSLRSLHAFLADVRA